MPRSTLVLQRTHGIILAVPSRLVWTVEMSARQVRRLAVHGREREVNALDEVESSAEGSDDDVDEGILQHGKTIKYSLLADSSSESESESDSGGRVTDMSAAHKTQTDPNGHEKSRPNPSVKRNKPSSTQHDRKPQPSHTDDFDLDVEHNSGPAAIVTTLDRLLLLPNPQCLNADGELVRVFGRAPTAPAGNAAAVPAGRRSAILAGGRVHGGGRSGALSLVTPDPPQSGQGWPFVAAPTAVSGGFSMRTVGDSAVSGSAAAKHFDIQCSSDYDRVAQEFGTVSSMGDPNLMMQWASQPGHLYVLQAIMALSDYYRTVRQPEASAMHLRRALYVIERAVHPSFRPWETPCRIAVENNDRDMPGNITALMFSVLFRAQASAAQSGAVEASFHLCQLTLQLCPPDMPGEVDTGGSSGWLGSSSYRTNVSSPGGGDAFRVALIADTAALRAGQDDWILAITGAEPAPQQASGVPATETSGPSRRLSAHPGRGPAVRYVCPLRGSTLPLVMLPGWGLARARALFRLQEKAATNKGGTQGQEARSADSSAGAHGTSHGSTTATPTAWLHQDTTFLSGPTTFGKVVEQWRAQGTSDTSGDTGSTQASDKSDRVPSAAGGRGGASSSPALDPATRTFVRVLLLYPHLLLPLLKALGIKSSDRGVFSVLGDAASAALKTAGQREGPSNGDGQRTPRAALSPKDCAWAPIFAHSLYSHPYAEYDKVRTGELEACDSRHWPDGLEHLVTIAAARHAAVWRSATALLWLHHAAGLACKAYDAARQLHTMSARGVAEGSGGTGAGQPQPQVLTLDAATIALAAEATTASELRRELWVTHRPGLESDEGESGDTESMGVSASPSSGRAAPGHRAGASSVDTDGRLVAAALEHYATAQPLSDYTDEPPGTMEADMAHGAGDGGGGHGGAAAGQAGRPAAARRGACGCGAMCRRFAEATGYNPVVVLIASLFPGYALNRA